MKNVLKVDGMKCKHCAKHVEEACLTVSGVKSAQVNLEEKEVVVEGENYSIDLIRDSITKAGYTCKF